MLCAVEVGEQALRPKQHLAGDGPVLGFGRIGAGVREDGDERRRDSQAGNEALAVEPFIQDMVEPVGTAGERGFVEIYLIPIEKRLRPDCPLQDRCRGCDSRVWTCLSASTGASPFRKANCLLPLFAPIC